MWEHQMSAFRDKYNVAAIDMRGYGQSGRPTVGPSSASQGACAPAGSNLTGTVPQGTPRQAATAEASTAGGARCRGCGRRHGGTTTLTCWWRTWSLWCSPWATRRASWLVTTGAQRDDSQMITPAPSPPVAGAAPQHEPAQCGAVHAESQRSCLQRMDGHPWVAAATAAACHVPMHICDHTVLGPA